MTRSKAMSELHWEFCPCSFDLRNFKHFCKHVITSLSSTCMYYSCLAAIPWLSSLVLMDKQSNAVMCPRKGNTGGTCVHVPVTFCMLLVCIFLFCFLLSFSSKICFVDALHISFPSLWLSLFSSCFRIDVGPFLLFRLCFGKMVWIRFLENAFYSRK